MEGEVDSYRDQIEQWTEEVCAEDGTETEPEDRMDFTTKVTKSTKGS